MADCGSVTRGSNNRNTPTEISSDTAATRTPSPNPRSPSIDPYYPEGLTPPLYQPTTYVPSGEGTSRAPPRNARISVRPPPTASNLGMGPASKRARFTECGSCNWMPDKLAEWRFIGSLEDAPDFGLASGYTPSVLMTREPIHLTIPTLVSQLACIEQRVDHIEPVISAMPEIRDVLTRMVRMERGMERCLAHNQESQDLIHKLHQELKMVREEASSYRYELNAMDMAMDTCNRHVEELEKKVEEHEGVIKGLRAALNTRNEY